MANTILSIEEGVRNTQDHVRRFYELTIQIHTNNSLRQLAAYRKQCKQGDISLGIVGKGRFNPRLFYNESGFQIKESNYTGKTRQFNYEVTKDHNLGIRILGYAYFFDTPFGGFRSGTYPLLMEFPDLTAPLLTSRINEALSQIQEQEAKRHGNIDEIIIKTIHQQ